MNPKKAKQFIKPVAIATDSSEELVSDLINFYWSNIRKSLSELKGTDIIVDGLGTFKIKDWKVNEIEEKYKKMLSRYNIDGEQTKLTFQRFAIKKEIETRLLKIEEMQKMISEEKLKQKQIKILRNAKVNKTNLE